MDPKCTYYKMKLIKWMNKKVFLPNWCGSEWSTLKTLKYFIFKYISHCMIKWERNFWFSLVTQGPVLLEVNPFKSVRKAEQSGHACNWAIICDGKPDRMFWFVHFTHLYSLSCVSCKHIRQLDSPFFFSSILILDANAEARSNWVLSWWL